MSWKSQSLSSEKVLRIFYEKRLQFLESERDRKEREEEEENLPFLKG